MRNIVIVSLFLIGCASSAIGPKFEALLNPKEGTGLAYFYRINNGSSTMIYIDGEKVELLDNGYYSVNLTPGLHIVKVRGNLIGIPGIIDQTKEFEILEGQRLYFKVYIGRSLRFGEWTHHNTIGDVSEVVAQVELKFTRNSNPINQVSRAP
jgi:hypothetical protein